MPQLLAPERETSEVDWHDGSELNFSSLRTPQSLRSAASSETHIPFRDAASPLSENTHFSSWSAVPDRRTGSRCEGGTPSGRASRRTSSLVLPPTRADQHAERAEEWTRVQDARVDTKEALARTAVTCLGAQDSRVRSEAFRTLRDLGALAAQPATSALETALLEGDLRTKLAAMSALSRVAALNASDGLVGALGSLLEDPSEELREAAAGTLGHVVPKGDERAMHEVTVRLGYENLWHIRASATRALAEISPKGDRRCVDMLVERVADKRHEVRLVAVPALSRVVEIGDATAIKALVARLEDSVGDVRVAAVHALPHAAARGDALAVAGASQRLDHPNWLVRLAAVRALAQVTDPGDSRAVGAAARGLEHSQWRVREDSTRFLPQLAPRGDSTAMGEVDARLGHGEWAVRKAAVQALGQVAKKGDARAVEMLGECLADEDVSVRWAAVQTLPKVVEKGDQQAIGMVRKKLEKGSWLVRLAAAHAIEKLGGGVEVVPSDPATYNEDSESAKQIRAVLAAEDAAEEELEQEKQRALQSFWLKAEEKP